jgi:transposase
MSISDMHRAEIRRLFFGEHWKVGTIANHLGIHDDTVRRTIDTNSFSTPGRPRPSMLDPYIEFVEDTLKQYPKLTATRLHDMLRPRGFQGSAAQLRSRIRKLNLRPKPRSEAFFRLKVFPGEQAQVDWGYFGQIRVGTTMRKLWFFVIVLSWSRAFDVYFSLDQSTPAVLRGHLAGFAHFGGVPRRILYDNMKTVVIERVGDAIRFHPRLLELSGHYLFGAYPCAPRRGNEKGRVERRIKDLRHSFMAGRTFVNLDDLRQQFIRWRNDIAYQRKCPDNLDITVAEALVQERHNLLPMPEHALCCDDVRAAIPRKQPYVIYDTNRYSVPHKLVGEPLTLSVSDTTVRVLHEDAEVARHQRSWDRHQVVEEREHLAALAEYKRKARALHGRSRLIAEVPAAAPMFDQLALRDEPLGPQTARLLKLLDQYGADELAKAITEAVARDTPRAASVARILDQKRRSSGLPPVLPPTKVPGRPELDDLHIRNHNLEDYDELADDES